MVTSHTSSYFEASNITVIRGSKKLLNDVSLQLAPGTVTTLVGPNGAGKSTLLKVMAGDIKPDSGDVFLDERSISQWTKSTLAQRRAVLPQHSELSFPFNAYDVVLIGREPHSNGQKRGLDQQIAHLAMGAVDIPHLAKRNYQELSGGEKQRVHLARVLAQIWPHENSGKQNYLLLDEPTSSLDLTHQHSLLQLVRQLAGKSLGILLVLHDLNLATQYSDKVIVLHAGQTLAYGNPETVLTHSLLKQVFGLEMTILQHPELRGPILVPLPHRNPTQTHSNPEQATIRSLF